LADEEADVCQPLKAGQKLDDQTFALLRDLQLRGASGLALELLNPQLDGIADLTPHDLRRTCAKLCRKAGGELEQIQRLLGHASIQTTERYLGTKQDLVQAVNDRMKIRVDSE
jgi:integrase